jgi:hypothetical protein
MYLISFLTVLESTFRLHWVITAVAHHHLILIVYIYTSFVL